MSDTVDLTRELRRTRWLAQIALAGCVLNFGALLMQGTRAASTPEVLTVRGLVVVDAGGVPRIALGAPAPDPMAGKREAPLTGLVINGADGRERGGYGVIDGSNGAILTLDSHAGDEVFKAYANEDGGASLFVMHGNGAAAAITTYRGKPELHLLDSDNKAVFKQPPGTPDMQ